MNRSVLVIALGVAITGFLLTAATVSLIFEPFIEFSVFIGIPVGLLAAVIVTAAAISALGRDPSRLLTSAFAGLAGFGYAVIGWFAIRYAVPASRQTLDFSLLLVLAVAVAGLVFVVVWVRSAIPD